MTDCILKNLKMKDSLISLNMENKEKEQETIKKWFNQTYSLRGFFYLRPVRAYRIFPSLLEFKPDHKVLDVACGLGRLLEASQEYGSELHGFDISDVAVEKAKKILPQAHIQVANAEEMPYADNTFDRITCLGSLERMIDLEKVLKEIKRVAKPDAKVLFLVRNINGWSWKLTKNILRTKVKASHQGAKSQEEWTSLFNKIGFEIKEILPDQYPIKKRQLFTSLGLKKIDYKKVSKAMFPMEYVHEYIYILDNSK